MISFYELIDKEYTLEMTLKDKDGKTVSTDSVDWKKDAWNYEYDVSTYCRTKEDYDEAWGEFMIHKMQDLVVKMDLNRFKDLEKLSKKFVWSYDNQEGLTYTQKDWNTTLLDEIDKAVFAINLEAGGEEIDEPMCIVASLEVSAILDDLDSFCIDSGYDSSPRTTKLGKLYGDGIDLIVYKNIYIPAGKSIVCYEKDLKSGVLNNRCVTASVEVINLPKLENYK